MCTTRPATESDLGAITEIYNEAILTTTGTFDTEPKTVTERRAWFESLRPRYPLVVAQVNGKVVGWAVLKPWSDRGAYADTAEVAVYVQSDHRGRGVGGGLMAAVLEAGRRAELHAAVARIAEGNETSVRLHESHGFFHVGVMKEVGFKFGRRLDIHLMQKLFDAPEQPVFHCS
jgi:phosphinothricin acetyltransferase